MPRDNEGNTWTHGVVGEEEGWTTASGHRLTPQEAEDIAREAENGYDLSQGRRRFSCAFCGEHISPDATDTCRKVTGWIERRKGGGAHSIRLPSAPIALAHQYCLDMAVDRQKVGQGQTSIF